MIRAVVFHKDPRRPWLAERSARSLRAAGFELGEAGDGQCLLLKAGHVLRNPEAFRPPPVMANGSLVAIGLPAAGEWSEFHASHGGDYPSNETLPPPVCEWHFCGNNAAARLNGGLVSG